MLALLVFKLCLASVNCILVTLFPNLDMASTLSEIGYRLASIKAKLGTVTTQIMCLALQRNITLEFQRASYIAYSQKVAFVPPLISWLPPLQPQRTPIEHWRESCTARLAVHYYPIFLIEIRNIWPINLYGWNDEFLSSSKMSLN